jgi:pimeloyl-ACP methyl ester carboxylesterase
VVEGAAVVLHPSLGRPAADFDHLVSALTPAGRTTIAVDPRGAATSTGALDGVTLRDLAENLVRVIEHLRFEAADFIGHAFGNRVVRQLATAWPAAVRSVVLLGAGGRIEGDETARAALVRCFGPSEPRAEHQDAVATAFFAPGNDAASWAGGWFVAAATAQGAAARAANVDDWWLGGTAPMLVVQGLEDRIAPPANGHLLAEQRGRTTVLDLPGAGHALLPERPAEIAMAVLEFLK